MTRMRTTAVVLVLAVIGAASSGCGAADEPVAVPLPGSPPAVTPPATPQADAPQSGDAAPVPAGWIEGSVTKGGAGPCFGLKSDDGVQYAMHSTEARTLKLGDRVRVQVTPSRLRISCGDGTQVQLQDIEALG